MCPTLTSPGCQTAQRAAAAEERVKRLEAALRYILDGFGLDAPHYNIDKDNPPRQSDMWIIQKARAALQEAQGDGE